GESLIEQVVAPFRRFIDRIGLSFVGTDLGATRPRCQSNGSKTGCNIPRQIAEGENSASHRLELCRLANQVRRVLNIHPCHDLGALRDKVQTSFPGVPESWRTPATGRVRDARAILHAPRPSVAT